MILETLDLLRELRDFQANIIAGCTVDDISKDDQERLNKCTACIKYWENFLNRASKRSSNVIENEESKDIGDCTTCKRYSYCCAKDIGCYEGSD